MCALGDPEANWKSIVPGKPDESLAGRQTLSSLPWLFNWLVRMGSLAGTEGQFDTALVRSILLIILIPLIRAFLVMNART